MFNHSGDERILGGRDTTCASCLLSIYSVIPCHLANAFCPTFFFAGSSAAENHSRLPWSYRAYFCLLNINRKYSNVTTY